MKYHHEWSMGNGQCEVCYGRGPSFENQSPFGLAACGHEQDCELAALLLAAGHTDVLFVQRSMDPQTKEERELCNQFALKAIESSSWYTQREKEGLRAMMTEKLDLPGLVGVES